MRSFSRFTPAWVWRATPQRRSNVFAFCLFAVRAWHRMGLHILNLDI
jgi:hypothetical protein